MIATSAAFELHAGPFSGGDLAVASFRGREALSRLFSFDVSASTRSDAATLAPSLLGQTATLVMNVEGRPPRVVRGIIASVEREGQPGVYGDVGFRVRIVPRLWLLKRRKRSRIFQDRSVVQIVDEVLSPFGIGRNWRLSAPAPLRTYCVQYQETDLAFVRRLLAEDGIYFSFEHPSLEPEAPGEALGEVLVLSNDAAYPAFDVTGEGLGEGLALLYREAEGLTPSDDFAFSFALARAVRSNVALLRDFDFRNPALLPTERAAAADAHGLAPTAGTQSTVALLDPDALEVYEHEADYREPEVSTPRAQQRLEQLRRRAVAARGASWCRFLQPGYRFTLEEHGDGELNGAYAVTAVAHEGRTPERGGGGEARPIVYQNTFACVPAEVAYRPRRPRREIQQVVETALVTGPPGQEIHTDGHGRVKVQFHWDRDGQGDDRSSCWMRVAQAWAGPGWGLQFIPRVGMEVLVTFLGGDTDRPVITGCLYNSVNPPSHDLPRLATRSGIRTRTSPGPDGYNELSFEDQRGQEVVHIHAQRDLSEVVRNDHLVTVGQFVEGQATGDQTVHIAANQEVSVGADQTVTVGGHRREMVRGGRTEVISEGAILQVDGLHEQWDDASFVHHVAESHVHVVGADLDASVAGNATLAIGGDQIVGVRGRRAVTVTGSAGTSVGEDYAVNAVKGAAITSAETVRLVCGDSVIELLPREIIITSPTITLLGTKAVVVHGEDAVLKLDQKATLVSKEVKLSGKDSEVSLTSDGVTAAAKKNVALYSKGASVVLDSDAAVDGGTVKLNCAGDNQGEYDEPDAIEASYVDLFLTRKAPKAGDPSQLEDRGVAGARYAVEASDGRIFKGVLDGEGKARVPIPKGAAKVSFPDYDKGRVKPK